MGGGEGEEGCGEGGRSGVVWREEWCGRSSGVGGKGMIEGVIGAEEDGNRTC